MRPCLVDEELFALVDGAVSEPDGRVLREHVAGCARCQKSVSKMERALDAIGREEPFDANAHADAIFARLDRAERATPSRGPGWWSRRASIVGAVAAAAAVLLGVGVMRRPSEFAPRGASSVGARVSHSAGVTVGTTDGTAMTPIASGARISRHARFVASARNVSGEDAYALVFAVDAKKGVHWLYPAFTSDATDPASELLAPSAGREVVMKSAVVFDDLDAGRLTVVTVLSRTPMHVSQIEKRGALDLADLRKDFPDADVTSIDVDVDER